MEHYTFKNEALSDFGAYSQELKDLVTRLAGEHPEMSAKDIMEMLLKDQGGKVNPKTVYDLVQEARGQ